MIPLFKVFVSEEARKNVNDVLGSGFIGQGAKVEEFEQKLGEYLEVPFVISLNSCTSGITLALKLLDLSPNDEVLVPSLTCVATITPICTQGLKLKWVDSDPLKCNVSIEDLKKKLSPTTKAIIVVHWGGYTINPSELREVQDYCLSKFGFHPTIIEDCAHAFGARYPDGTKVGSSGNMCVFSFQAIKTLTTGDGGALVVPSVELYQRAKLLRWFGIDRNVRNYNSKDSRLENDITETGFKFHMNDINASIGLGNLPHAETLLTTARGNARYYVDRLREVEGVTLVQSDPFFYSSYWLFTIRISNKERFMKIMREKGVMVSQVHNRNDLHSFAKEYLTSLQGVDLLEQEMVCIPCGWWVTSQDREYIVECVQEAIKVNDPSL